MTDDYGHNIFETIKITLVCDDCLKTDHPEKYALASNLVSPFTALHLPYSISRCRHKLASMPRWLSSKKVETVRALLAGASLPSPPAAHGLTSPCVAQRTLLCY